jgi:hypothetical protein
VIQSWSGGLGWAQREYFQLQAILFVTVSDSLATCNMSGQSKKVGCRCPHCFRETYSQYLSESQKSVYGTLTLHCNETPVSEYEGSIQW